MKRDYSTPGWYQANNSDLFHIFIDGKPLCGKKIYKMDELISPFGRLVKPITENIGVHYCGCKGCAKKNKI